MLEHQNELNSLAFTVDAGLIDRLGRELVGREETAVSELVKNAYDADATEVKVRFINSYIEGGTLEIRDNGAGMDLEQLHRGFMTISSTDKIHNPKSARFKRNKAGRKGIGRFATQRLGKKLTIITQTVQSEIALKVTVDWTQYKIDTDISSIYNPIEEIPKIQEEGTILIIENLRDAWSDASINRVFRYISDLLQPDYLSDRSRKLNIARQKEESFTVSFFHEINGTEYTIADPNKMLFDKALAVIEGYVDLSSDGYCSVASDSLGLDAGDIIKINFDENEEKFNLLNDVHFKAYYFIYNREQYYTNITKLELNNILRISSEQGGMKLYRNGFRVLPYGEPNDDWLDIDRRYYNESGTNIPFGNRNLFGFVEVLDSEGALFEETASREGLIENEAYKQLRVFVKKALDACRNRIRSAVYQIRQDRPSLTNQPTNPNLETTDKTPIEKLDDLNQQVDNLPKDSSRSTSEEEAKSFKEKVADIKEDVQHLMKELEMLRVLAGLGLTIGEFTHEVVQFSPSMKGDLSVIAKQHLNDLGKNALENLIRTINVFTSYTSYFNATVSANVSREMERQEIDTIINRFIKIIESDLKRSNIEIETEYFEYDLFTIPMHVSEWSSILFNLYTNAKKAIKRAGKEKGKIRIVAGKENNRIYLEFSDNGDGIPEENKQRIFAPFFTTSSPTGFEDHGNQDTTGTGLGLKIVKDIIESRQGKIEVIDPEQGYMTCFKIELPLYTIEQIENEII